jgi:DUF4097 and DUF4098 domain-containing protein YvlB
MMPTFETPEPITIQVELGVGDLRVTMVDGGETSVEVSPSNRGKRDDVLAAEQTEVEFSGNRLLIRAPKTWKRWSPFSDGGSVDVRISSPAGSELNTRADLGAVHATGALGACRVHTGMGNVNVEDATSLDLRTGMGDIVVGRVKGTTEVSTGTGKVRIDALEGRSVVKNSNGDCLIGEAGADLRVSTANGDIEVDRAVGSVVAKTANGDIRLHELVRGTVAAETGCGALVLGIADGTAAYLDLNTSWGDLRSELEQADEPVQGAETVDVRAKTAAGDITVRRA